MLSPAGSSSPSSVLLRERTLSTLSMAPTAGQSQPTNLPSPTASSRPQSIPIRRPSISSPGTSAPPLNPFKSPVLASSPSSHGHVGSYSSWRQSSPLAAMAAAGGTSAAGSSRPSSVAYPSNSGANTTAFPTIPPSPTHARSLSNQNDDGRPQQAKRYSSSFAHRYSSSGVSGSGSASGSSVGGAGVPVAAGDMRPPSPSRYSPQLSAVRRPSTPSIPQRPTFNRSPSSSPRFTPSPLPGTNPPSGSASTGSGGIPPPVHIPPPSPLPQLKNMDDLDSELERMRGQFESVMGKVKGTTRESSSSSGDRSTPSHAQGASLSSASPARGLGLDVGGAQSSSSSSSPRAIPMAVPSRIGGVHVRSRRSMELEFSDDGQEDNNTAAAVPGASRGLGLGGFGGRLRRNESQRSRPGSASGGGGSGASSEIVGRFEL
jgi:hypothetical protein